MRLNIHRQADGSYSALINDTVTQMFLKPEDIAAYIAGNPTEDPIPSEAGDKPEPIKEPHPVSYKDKIDHSPPRSKARA